MSVRSELYRETGEEQGGREWGVCVHGREESGMGGEEVREEGRHGMVGKGRCRHIGGKEFESLLLSLRATQQKQNCMQSCQPKGKCTHYPVCPVQLSTVLSVHPDPGGVNGVVVVVACSSRCAKAKMLPLPKPKSEE